MSFPRSRHHRCSISAVSKSWFIPDSNWTPEDYEKSDRILRRIGDVLIVLIFVVWIVRFARTGRVF
jgi:hypothetical protein